jgi:transcriptional regulator with XRE-family HTH domain
MCQVADTALHSRCHDCDTLSVARTHHLSAKRKDPEPEMVEAGTRLKTYMDAHSPDGALNKLAIEKATGISRSTIGMWLKGRSNPTRPTLELVASVLRDASADEMVAVWGLPVGPRAQRLERTPTRFHPDDIEEIARRVAAALSQAQVAPRAAEARPVRRPGRRRTPR